MIRPFLIRIVLPTLLTVALFVGALFAVFIPSLEQAIMARKREMIRELTISAWNIMANLDAEAKEGLMTREQAQAQAILQVRSLHYGPDMKDYFWINDMTPTMIVHPYRPDLEGQDLSSLTDPEGKRVFMAFVDMVRDHDEGYVEYMWQWKDEPAHIVPKLSFVRGFKPWGWIIGTGVYLEDVRHEIQRVSRHLAAVSALILTAMSALLLFIVTQSLRTERRRLEAENALRHSEERYRGLVESASETLIMAMEGEGLFANANAARQLGYSPEELRLKRLDDLIEPTADGRRPQDVIAEHNDTATDRPVRLETALIAKDGTRLPVVLSCSRLSIGQQTGVAVVATDMSEHSLREAERDRSEERLRRRLELLEHLEASHRQTLDELKTALMLLDHPVDEAAPTHLLQDIRNAKTTAEIITLNQRIPELIKILVKSGYRAENINRLVTVNTDVVVKAFIDAAIRQIGTPPCPFAFLIMGSEGRREQTLCTDQDNAIIFADDGGPDAQPYFQHIGDLVCTWLDSAGYALCTGAMMASNPAWRQPCSGWVETFRGWIRNQEAQDLLHTKVFFDVRCAYGDATLVDTLRENIERELLAHERFFGQLAHDILQVAPPLGLFGKIQLTTTADGRRGFDIKSAMTPIVDFARIYSLRHGLDVTNTLDRLEALARLKALPHQTVEDVVQIYSSLMQIRIEHQVDAMTAGRPPDNFIDPETLNLIEKRILKESFSLTKDIQTRLSYDFTGMSGRP